MNKKISTSKNNKKPQKNKLPKSFPIVGIGASAGGLEALEGFFSHMPSDSNIAFVVIQHLDPKHKSIMGSLLAKYTTMKIHEVEDGMIVEPNCVYMTPPNKKMVILNGILYLMELEKTHSVNLPINHFFRSLSNDQAEKAICIILSGTGTDGTLGARAIKGAGGMTMVQEEKQAKYDGMPRSAIDTGLIDYVLPVEKMPERLIQYIQHPYIKAPEDIEVTNLQYQNYLQKIFALIRSQTGHDFSNYKLNTIRRRIERRLAMHQIENIADYVSYIQQTPAEVDILFKDMLITVTNFFRDPESFMIMKEKIIPLLLKNLPADSSFRCWIPGCATGEEAYSIAMLLVEAMEESHTHFNLQVFATDIDGDSIEIARLGVYPDSIAADVSPERLKRFFVKEEKSFRIKKQIREMVVFATQSLIKDPPFSKLDLVSCRNLLIYMDSVLQKKIIPLFHYTLNQNGILFLGSSESVGEFSDLFLPLDTKWKIFQRLGEILERDVDYPKIPFQGKEIPYKKFKNNKAIGEADIRNLAQKLILEEYSPSYVLINEQYDILYFSGDTEKYLSPPVGEPSFNILKMAREDIRYKISTAIHTAMKQNKSVVIKDLRIKHNSSYLMVDLIVRPIAETNVQPGVILMVFKDKTLQVITSKKNLPERKAENQRIVALEQELQSAKEYLRTTVEELETLNEEQKSTTEEMQSTNEELQSTNEELETSKEELQSTNEELLTLNSELQTKIDELSLANNDINNLLASTEIGTIFLDTKLCIKRFTPTMTKMFNLIPSDIGRPISDITANISYSGVYEDAKDVLATLMRKEVEIQTKNRDWFSMRISPYRTTDNVIDGIVITFVDITKIKEAESSERLATVVKDSNDAITLLDLKGNILAWNKGAKRMYGYSEDEALKMNISEIVPDEKQIESLDLIKQIKAGNTVESFITMRKAKDGSNKKIWLTVTKLVDEKGIIHSIATTERDLSELERVEEI